MKPKTKKLIKSLIGWVLYLGFLVGLIYGVPRGLAYVLKTDYPMASITSGSMWPALKKGDLILIKGVADAKEEVELNDIIVYKNPSTSSGQGPSFTIHRVIKLNEETLVTKGDANNVADNPIKYEDVIGELLTFNERPVRIPLLGSISLLINRNKI